MRKPMPAFGILLLTASLAALTLSATSTARAWLKVCNGTDKTVQYEHAINSSGSCGSSNPWRDVGWWTMLPGECKQVDSGSMTNRYYYYFAESLDKQYVWTSDRWTWTVDKAAHNVCEKDQLSCTTNGAGPCPGLRVINHREARGTTSNVTMTLN